MYAVRRWTSEGFNLDKVDARSPCMCEKASQTRECTRVFASPLPSSHFLTKENIMSTNVTCRRLQALQSCNPNAFLSMPNLFFFSVFPTTRGAVLGGPLSL